MYGAGAAPDPGGNICSMVWGIHVSRLTQKEKTEQRLHITGRVSQQDGAYLTNEGGHFADTFGDGEGEAGTGLPASASSLPLALADGQSEKKPRKPKGRGKGGGEGGGSGDAPPVAKKMQAETFTSHTYERPNPRGI